MPSYEIKIFEDPIGFAEPVLAETTTLVAGNDDDAIRASSLLSFRSGRGHFVIRRHGRLVYEGSVGRN